MYIGKVAALEAYVFEIDLFKLAFSETAAAEVRLLYINSVKLYPARHIIGKGLLFDIVLIFLCIEHNFL